MPMRRIESANPASKPGQRQARQLIFGELIH